MKNRKIPETASQPRRDLLAVARQLHADGDLDAAEKHYRKILRKRPRHPEALHLLGMIANQRGENIIALDLMQQSVRIKSDEPYYYNNLGLVLNALDRYEEAGECYRKALSLDSQLPMFTPILCALALQCFTNDYVYTITDVELGQLRGKIENELGITGDSRLRIALLASYAPLYRQSAENILAPAELSRVPLEFQALIRRQLTEPLRT